MSKRIQAEEFEAKLIDTAYNKLQEHRAKFSIECTEEISDGELRVIARDVAEAVAGEVVDRFKQIVTNS